MMFVFSMLPFSAITEGDLLNLKDLEDDNEDSLMSASDPLNEVNCRPLLHYLLCQLFSSIFN